MESDTEKRSRVVDEILSDRKISTVLFQCIELELEEAGSKPCSLLLQRAIQHLEEGRWARCHEIALKAREYAWEQLHSGKSWQTVAKVHRDAYGVSGTLVAIATFISGEADSLDNAVYALDLVAMMAGGHFQGVANTFVEAMEADSCAKTDLASRVGAAQSPSAGAAPVATRAASAPDGARPKKAKHDHSMATGRPGSGRGIVCRVRMPPLDVFRRDYMETETPVILSGVSERTPVKAACCAW
ncbi:unnamed protein product, partial [Ectocarpus fasciculatus]